MEHKKNFNKAEEVERKAINWFARYKGSEIDLENISDVGSYSTEDFTFTSGRTFVVAEVKIRDFSSSKYETAYLELDKINRLCKKGVDYAASNVSILYFAFYKGDNTLYIIDLMNTPHKIVYKNCPVSSMDLSRGRVHKAICEFNLTEAIEKINIKKLN